MNKQTLLLESNSHQETLQLAFQLGSILNKGVLITLEGNLAAGKTTFTQGLAQGLGVKEVVNSPTFVIMKEYEGRLPLVHIDAYRLEGISQDLGFEDYLDESSVVVIEWANYLEFIDEYDPLQIKISVIDEESRMISLYGDQELIERLKSTL